MSTSSDIGASQYPSTAEIGAAGAPATAGVNPWILNFWKDLVLFVATPLLIIPFVFILHRFLPADDISLYVISFGALGHHLPGMLRAYGDRELFARFRVRFIVAPLFLLSVCSFFTFTDLFGLFVISLIWGMWHSVAQIYGFLRIYDAKAKSFSRITAKLDMAMCVSWFVLAVWCSPDRLGNLIRAFYRCGGPLLPAEMVHALKTTWIVVTAVVTVAFLANCVWQWRHGHPPSALKLLLMVSSIGFWWYTVLGIHNTILGIAMFEIFHDVQYLAIVWVFNIKRVQTGHRVGGFTRFLFRRSWLLAGLYVGIVFAYGSIQLFTESTDVENIKGVLVGLVAASGFLHFYYDGFIWKVRENSTREGLGLSGGQSQGDRRWVPSWFRHGLYWSLFVVPLALSGMAELRGVQPKMERELSIVKAVPENVAAHNNLANALISSGRVEKAVAHFQEALRIKPEYAKAHFNLGNALHGLKRFDEAKSHYQEALRIKPNFAEAYINLGMVLHREGKIKDAIAQYKELVRIQPDSASAHFRLGNALRDVRRVEEAITHFEEALRIKPDFVLVHHNLAEVFHAAGRSDEAVAHFQDIVRIKPESEKPRFHLANTLRDMRRFDEAKSYYQEALQINPNMAHAHYNLGAILEFEGNVVEAIAHFQEELRVNPDHIESHFHLGNDMRRKTRFHEAIAHYKHALRIKPNFAEAHNGWGLALTELGQLQDAVEHFQIALRLKANYQKARDNLRKVEAILRRQSP